MKTITVTINDVDYQTKFRSTGNRGNDIRYSAKNLCEELGIDWKSAKVFAQHGEKGRCYTKQPGFMSLEAHG